TTSLLGGFSIGQVQYLDLIEKSASKLFSKEWLVDKTKYQVPVATCTCTTTETYAPGAGLLKQGHAFPVYTAKRKGPLATEQPTLAGVCQKGCLRVFHSYSLLPPGLLAEACFSCSGALTANLQRSPGHCGSSLRATWWPAPTSSSPHPPNPSGRLSGTPGSRPAWATPAVPGLHEVQLLAPLHCSKMAPGQPVLLLLEERSATAAQEGLSQSWAGPDKVLTDEETEARAGVGPGDLARKRKQSLPLRMTYFQMKVFPDVNYTLVLPLQLCSSEVFKDKDVS
ncbi:hypothetical protein HPG69_010355, partial [Diceros bicornis minor]